MDAKPVKPQMKSEIGIRFANPSNRCICFDATPDMMSTIGEFGTLDFNASIPCLFVDARFDFWQVAKYLESL